MHFKFITLCRGFDAVPSTSALGLANPPRLLRGSIFQASITKTVQSFRHNSQQINTLVGECGYQAGGGGVMRNLATVKGIRMSSVIG